MQRPVFTVAVLDLFLALYFDGEPDVIDRLLAIFGIVVTIVIFVLQSRYPKIPKLVIDFALLLTGICLGVGLAPFLWLSIQGQNITPEIASKESPEKTEKEAGLANFPTFEEIYKAAPNLGHPISQVIFSNSAYVEGHEKALMLWFQPLNHLIRFDINNTGLEIDQTLQPSDKYRNDKDNQKLLNLSIACLPPYAGFAEAWEKDPKNWSPSGCRQWRCIISNLKYMAFEHGFVVTGVPENVGTTQGDSFFFTRTGKNGGTWSHLSMTTKIPACELFPTD